MLNGTVDGAPTPWSGIADLLEATSEEGGTTKYSRAHGLRALVYPMAATGLAAPALAYAKAPAWTVTADVTAFGIVLTIYLLLYLYCFVRRPHFLRSENFELTKYAIEKRWFGDSTTGLIEAASASSAAGEPVNIGGGSQ